MEWLEGPVAPYRSWSRSQAINSSTERLIALTHYIERHVACAHSNGEGCLALRSPSIRLAGQPRRRAQWIACGRIALCRPVSHDRGVSGRSSCTVLLGPRTYHW